MSANRWLGLILAVYVVLGAAYAWVVPLGEAPDEIDHFLYVRHLVEQRAFPVMYPIATTTTRWRPISHRCFTCSMRW